MSNNLENNHIPAEVIIVEASAGSGKTYALAKRYLNLLLNPQISSESIPLRSILAITFTNKATVEMKERILELLKKIAFHKFSSADEEADILGALGIDKNQAAAKAQAVIDKIIKHYNFFQVQTIDSFINALLLGCALKIERSASFKIKRDYSLDLVYCLDVVIEQASTDKQILNILEEFLNHYLFVENRTGWFPKEDIIKLMLSLFRLSNKYGGVFVPYDGESEAPRPRGGDSSPASAKPAEANPPSLKLRRIPPFCSFAEAGKEIVKKKKTIFGLLEKLMIELPEGINGTFKKTITSFFEKNNTIFDLKDFPEKFKDVNPPMNKGKAAPPEFEEQWKKISESISDLAEFESKVIYSPYVKLFRVLAEYFKNLSQKEDVLFLEELNRQAQMLFADDGGVTVAELYYRLATRFKHYLIDEFQDTSVLQWRNLYTMVEEALSCGGSLFYVGDKKQAIYRFRGGEAKLFDQVKADFNYRFNAHQEQLTKNWRSQKEIVEFNNKIFSESNLRNALASSGIGDEIKAMNDGFSGILNVFKDAQQSFRVGSDYGYVKIEHLAEANIKERNEIVEARLIELIDQLKYRFRYQDIAILTRNNEEVELVTTWLIGQGISVESEKTLNVLENYLVKELILLLKFLQSPIDDLSFAGFILGEIFTKASGISHEQVKEFIFTLRKDKKIGHEHSLYRNFRNKFPEIWDNFINEFFRNVGFISCYELVVSIYRCFKIPENFPEFQGFFMKFLEVIKVSEDEYAGLGEFLTYLDTKALSDNLYVNIVSGSSIKVLTIHKAKGLEFPVVIIPFLEMDINPETAGKDTSSYVIGEGTPELGLVRITKSHRLYSEECQRIYAESYQRACIDELNNIYVALTRAQYELYVFVPAKSGNSKNKAACLIPAEFSVFGEQKVYEIPQKDEQAYLEVGLSCYQNWIEKLREEFDKDSLVKNRRDVLSGNILHRFLYYMGNCYNQDTAKLIKKSAEMIKAEYNPVEDIFVYENKIKILLNQKILEPFFYVSDGKVYCEKEIVNSFGDLKRIDRLIVKNDEVWVVDYKSSSDNEEFYRGQVSEYIKLISAIYPKCKPRGFIIYLDQMTYAEI